MVEDSIIKSGCGILCQFNFADLCKGLKDVNKISEDINIRKLGKEYVKESHSYETMAESIVEIIQKVRLN